MKVEKGPWLVIETLAKGLSIKEFIKEPTNNVFILRGSFNELLKEVIWSCWVVLFGLILNLEF